MCNAAVYFPNAHKEGVFLPGLFPGGGPRWSAEGHEMSFAANYLGPMALEVDSTWMYRDIFLYIYCNTIQDTYDIYI